MIKILSIQSGMLKLQEGVIGMTDERPARLENLPTTVRGFCYHDDDGEEFIVLNSRLTREQNRITYDHERAHIKRNELHDPNYVEYK